MKIVKEDYNKKAGTYTITLADKDGIYIGTAHEKENDSSNLITGGTIAYLKAYRKFFKNKLKFAKIKYKTLLNFQKDIFRNANDSSLISDYIKNRINKNLNIYDKEIQDILSSIQEIDEEILSYLKEKEKYYKKLLSKDKNNN